MKITSSKTVYSSRVFDVTEDEAQDASGFHIERSIVRHKGSAVMMAVEENRVLLVRQYRLPAEQFLWELPAGKLDAGETPLEAAKRELAEETGCRATEWRELVTYYPSPGYVEERMTIFLATGLTQGVATPMDDEQIETRWFERAELRELIFTNQIQDGKTLIGFLIWDSNQSPA